MSNVIGIHYDGFIGFYQKEANKCIVKLRGQIEMECINNTKICMTKSKLEIKDIIYFVTHKYIKRDLISLSVIT